MGITKISNYDLPIILLHTQFGQAGSLRAVVFRQFSLLVGFSLLGGRTFNLVRLGRSGQLCSVSSLCWLGGSGWDTQFGQVGSLRSVGFHQFSLLVGWIRLGYSIWSGWVTQVGCVPSVLSVGWVDQVGTLNLVRL